MNVIKSNGNMKNNIRSLLLFITFSTVLFLFSYVYAAINMTLTATAVNQSTINLSWSNPGMSYSFSLERSTSATGTFSVITTTGPGVTSYSDQGIAPNTTLYYRVRGKTGNGKNITYTNYSSVVSATTPPPDTIPPTTAITYPLQGQALTGSVTVLANASDNYGVEKVELWRDGILIATDTTAPYSFDQDLIVPSYNYDMNGDGKVDASDKLIMAQCQAHLLSNPKCDINGDGHVDATDKLLMSNEMAHIANKKVFSFQTKAYDASGNVGVSPIISINALPLPILSASNVLVVYNTNSPDSVTLKDYYITHRPEFTNVNVLGISTSDVEIMSLASYQSDIRSPVVNWLQANPTKQIYYIVLLRGVPDRISNPNNDIYSVDMRLSVARADISQVGAVTYSKNSGCGDYSLYVNSIYCPGGNTGLPYIPAKYPGTTALVTHLNMGSLAATKAYIDKLTAMYNAMPIPNVIISASAAGRGGINIYIDGAKTSAEQHITQGIDVLGYSSWGANSDLGGDYAINGTVKFTGNSNWYLIKTSESFNGMWVTWQGNFVDWFSANAFGGTNYSNTPVGAVTHVEEPSLDGVNGLAYFPDWGKGMLFIDSAWDSRRTPYFMAVGDPLIVK